MFMKSDEWSKSNATQLRTMEGLLNGSRRRKLSHSEKGKEVAGGHNLPDLTVDLSDRLLFLILSFLPMKDAARTSVLCRRWRNLWISRRSIRFDVDEILGYIPSHSRCAGNVLYKCEPSTSEEFDEFVRLVNRYFDFKLGSEIKGFGLHIRERFHYKYVAEWLNLVNQMNVEKLDLDFRGSDSNNPFHLFVAGHVSSLKHFSAIQCVMSMYPYFDGFNSLASLALENVAVPDDFISYCPVLEKLSLIDCGGLISLTVSPSLKNLKHVTVINSASFLSISAESLVSFKCSGCLETYLYPFNVNDDFCSTEQMGFPDPKNSPVKCIFTPDPDFGGFKSLRVLILSDASLRPLHLRYLLHNCSSVEELTFEDCSIVPGPSCTLEISGLLHLRSLKVVNCSGVGKVTVCATNLKSFVFYAAAGFHRFLRESFRLLDNDGEDFSPAVGKGSLLRHLHLRGSSFISDISNFSALETIILDDMYLSDELIGALLSNCFFLERLTLKGCYDIFTLNIVGPSLRLKYLGVCYCKQLKEIRISAANLMEFKYYGPLVCFSLREVPQLVSVEIKVEANDYDISTTHVLSMLSEDIPQLQSLIYHIEDQNVPDALPPFLNLKHLVLIFGNQTHKLSWATLFLLASPFLEKLRVQLPRYLSEVTENTTLSKEWIHDHLKKVELYRFSGIKKEIKVATSVLQNARSLQLMKIDPRPVHNPSTPLLDWVHTGRWKTIRLLKKEAMPGAQLVIL